MNGPFSLLIVGYMLAVVIETPVLVVGLGSRIPVLRRIVLGLWLSGCTYPFVGLVFPILIYEPGSRWVYVLVSEVFAPVAECALYRWNTGSLSVREGLVIVLANLASYGVGELVFVG